MSDQLFPAAERGDRAGALKALATADAAVDDVLAKTLTIDGHLAKRHDAAVAAARTATSDARLFALLAALAAVALAIAISLWIVRGIRRGVVAILDSLDGVRGESGELSTALDAAAGGDLTVEVVSTTERDRATSSGDEIGRGRAAPSTRSARPPPRRSAPTTACARACTRSSATSSSAAQAVAGSSQQMASTSEESGRAVGEIAHAIGEVAQGARAPGAQDRVDARG